MGVFGQCKPGATDSRAAGLLRAALAGFVVVAWVVLGGATATLLAAGLALVHGVLLVAGRPRFLTGEPLSNVLLDSLTLGLLVAGTGGAGSSFFPLYLLAAMGVAGVSGRGKVAVATAALVGGYLVAVGLAGVAAGLGAATVALACIVVALWGYRAREISGREEDLSAALSEERDRAARAEGLVSGFGVILGASSVEEILAWTARSARDACGCSYAHVATFEGNHHASVMSGDAEAYPSWWHPSVQDLLLRARREGGAVRSGAEVYGTKDFLAVPLESETNGIVGAVIVGGGDFGDDEERALALVSAAAGFALEAADGSPGGRDPVSGLPNRASLHRVLRRELSQGRTLTILAVGLVGLDDYNRTHGFPAGDRLLRRIGGRLAGGRRAFHHGGDEFVVVLGGTGEARARRTALAIQQAISEEAEDWVRAAVGFVHAGPEPDDPDLVVEKALSALRGGKPEAADRTGEIVEALVGALEAKDPGIGDHLRGVCRISRDIARRVGIPDEQVEILVTGALLHDIGKVGIPDHILHKPGRLTDEEYGVIKRHPILGAQIVAPVAELAPTLPIVRHHHERFDGGGYPDGLRGEDIPLQARIVSVADAFDSMIRSRPYGYGVSHEVALGEIDANSGSQFDPRIVAALKAVLEAGEGRRAGFMA